MGAWVSSDSAVTDNAHHASRIAASAGCPLPIGWKGVVERRYYYTLRLLGTLGEPQAQRKAEWKTGCAH